MLFFQNDDNFDYEMYENSQRVLDALKEERESSKIDGHKKFLESKKRFDYGKELFDPYDDLTFESKLKVDLMFYEKLLANLDEKYSEVVQEILSSLYKDVREIYEQMNIAPELYGKSINYDILEEGLHSRNQKIGKVVYEYLEKNFYTLSPEERKERWYEKHLSLAKELMTEQKENVEDSISHSVKTVVMEQLLRQIAFPLAPLSRLNYLCESYDYGQVFEQERLVELSENVNKKIRAISKIVSACI